MLYWSESGLGSDSIDLELDVSYGLLSLIIVFSSILAILYSIIVVRRGAEERRKEGLLYPTHEDLIMQGREENLGQFSMGAKVQKNSP